MLGELDVGPPQYHLGISYLEADTGGLFFQKARLWRFMPSYRINEDFASDPAASRVRCPSASLMAIVASFRSASVRKSSSATMWPRPPREAPADFSVSDLGRGDDLRNWDSQESANRIQR
jgi:hypothetical protein